MFIKTGVSKQVRRDPLLGRSSFFLGRQNLCYNSIVVEYVRRTKLYSVLLVANYQTLRTAALK